MTDNGFWINRIVETGAADPQELAKGFNPLNWRGHPESQREALEEALDSIGILQRVLVNRRSGRVIDGHLRIELAVLKGQPLIPVDYVELTDDEEALALATLDAITEQAEPIADKLAALLERTREMTADKPGLAGMLEALRQRAGVNGHVNTIGWGDAFGGLPNGEKSPFQQMTFTLHDSQMSEVIRALNLAKQTGDFADSPNENSNGNALNFICETFITAVGNGQG